MQKTLTHKEISQKGGYAVLEKHGRDHFSKMGKAGAAAKRKLYGPEYFKALSEKMIAARRKNAATRKFLDGKREGK
jgi:hypothetical protein